MKEAHPSIFRHSLLTFRANMSGQYVVLVKQSSPGLSILAQTFEGKMSNCLTPQH